MFSYYILKTYTNLYQHFLDCDLRRVIMKIFFFLLSIAWRLPSWNRQVLDVKALIYLPHSCVIFVAIVSVFLLDDRWSVPRPYRKPKSWRIGGSSWKFKMLWFFFFLLLNPPFVYVLLSRRWSIPLEDLTSKEKDPHFWWEAFAPLFGRVDCGFSQVCLLVTAPDFRTPHHKFFCFVLPSCAFPSGIVSEHNDSTCLHCEADIVQKIDQRLSHLLSLIMPGECMICGETPVVFTCWCCLSVGE